MKEDFTSFISEHTAEFALIPNIINIIKNEYEYVVPIFPWLNREGGRLAHSLHQNEEFKVIGIYPRRPKFDSNRTSCLIKINEELIETAVIAKIINIPMIAGAPISKNLWELYNNPICKLFHLTDDTQTLNFIDLNNTLENEIDLLLIVRQANPHTYQSFISAVRYLRQGNSRMFFSSTYKPVYLLIK